MGKKFVARTLLLPIIVALLTILSVPLFHEPSPADDLMPVGMNVIVALLFMFFLGIYFLIIAVVLPLHYVIGKNVQNKWIAFILFNVIGVVLTYFTTDFWFLYEDSMQSMYLIFPLYAILSFVPLFDEKADYKIANN